MKTLFALILLAPMLTLADDAAKAKKIEELIHLSGADKISQQMIDQLTPLLKAQMGKQMPAEQRDRVDQIVQELAAKISEKLSWENLGPVFVKVYSETYSEDEIEGIVTFYRSPAGQAMVQKMPVLIQKTTAYTQEMLGDFIQNELPGIIKQLQEKYQK